MDKVRANPPNEEDEGRGKITDLLQRIPHSPPLKFPPPDLLQFPLKKRHPRVTLDARALFLRLLFLGVSTQSAWYALIFDDSPFAES